MGKSRQTGNLVSENNITVNISNDRIGIGLTNPETKLDVSGSFNVSGISTLGITSTTNLTSQQLSVSGISTLAGNVFLGDNTDDDITVSGEFISNLIPDPTASYDLGSTTQRWRDVWSSGTVTASSFSGSGSALTGIVTSIVAGTNITISGSTGSVTIDAAGGGGGSGTFDTGITTSIYVSVTSGIGINTSQTNDIFVGPGIAYSFPSTSGKEYVIESIHISNSFSNELYFVGRHDFSGGSNVPLAQRVIVPYQGATEFLDQPIVANPSDILRFQALSGTESTATGIDGGLDAWITYSTKDSTDYVGTGKTVTTASGTEIFQASTNPAMLQSIKLCNYSLNTDIDASISIYRGSLATGIRLGYLVYNLTIPKNSVIEILEKPKYLAASDSIVGGASAADVLGVTLSGKYIV
jgi:hypothetical protein